MDNGEEEVDDIDMALNQLKQEEKEESHFIQKRLSSDFQKAKSVQTQKKIFDLFLHQRILMQGLLQKANKMPTHLIIDQFRSRSKTIDHNIIECKKGLKKHLKDLVKLQKQLFTISETKIDLALPESESDLYLTVDRNFDQILPFVNETIDRWNSRTTTAKNLGAKSKQFGKTILEQVESILNE